MKSLFFVNEPIKTASGVGKKILSQFKALKQLTHDCELVQLNIDDNRYSRFVGDKILEKFGRGKLSYIRSLFSYNTLFKYIVDNGVEFIYIRYSHFANPSFIYFLRQLHNHSVRIALEIPTYPYDQEYNNVKGIRRFKFYLDKVFRLSIGKYVTKIVTFSEDSCIWGAECVNISNAVDPEVVKISAKSLSGCVNFIAVANLAVWHGYDRFIRSLAAYYASEVNTTPIHFHLVGDGEELLNLQFLAKTLNVQTHISFHGALDGDKLDHIFDICHVGVDSLGRHRSLSNYNNSLKSKEYLMRGLPFIKSHFDRSLDNTNLYYQLSSDDNVFDLREVINWYVNASLPSDAIREFAINNFVWVAQFKKVMNAYSR